MRTRIRMLPLFVAVIVVLGVPAGVFGALRAAQSDERERLALETQPVVGPNETPPGAIPKLTRRDVAVARRAFAGDPYVARLLAGHRHTVVGPGVYHTGRALLGAVFLVEYLPSEQVGFRGVEIPVVPFDPATGFAPLADSVVQRFSGELWGFNATVDLKRGGVAEISPLGEITERPPAWDTYPPGRSD